MNKVNNCLFGKVFRTLGYLLILVASFCLSLGLINLLDVKFLIDSLKPVTDFLSHKNYKYIFDNLYFIFAIGLLLILWTQTKSYFVKVVVTIIGIGTLLTFNSVTGGTIFLPFKTNIPYLIQFNEKDKWIELALIVLSIFPVYLVLAYRKPEALSATLTSAGLLVTVLAIAATYLTINLNTPIFHKDLYITISNWTMLVGLLITSLGSIVGLLALFRK